MTNLVLRSDSGGVATLTFNRPEALNALSPSLFIELRAHLDELATATETIGCVILRGAGKSFSAGNDIKAIQSGDRAPSTHFQAETLDAIEALPQPVIAQVHGHCYTGALEVMLACDLAIAAESARFADTHGRWSMTPTWGMSQRLPRRIGTVKAKELMFTGHPISGQEAAAIGLVNRCVTDDDLEAAVSGLAAEIVANSWHTLRADKRLVNEGQQYTLAEGLAYERRTSPGAGPDMAERLKSFGSKKS
ncbi:MAG: enoyl-CoA hydratase/isomerase family protein [Dehalococcoidia bacterium]|nr:enoyl-CoA hydratase/isomerase family protein [Dehalococcoidia bacterium]